jgi:hypothetical protein
MRWAGLSCPPIRSDVGDPIPRPFRRVGSDQMERVAKGPLLKERIASRTS